MRARKLGFAAVLVPALFVASPALGQTAPASAQYPNCTREITKAESDAAHAKYLSGKVDYDEGKYDAAIQNFRAAYEKDCSKHELLVIISRSYELNNNLPEAIRALEVYLDRMPNASDASIHKSKIGTLKGRLAEQQKAAAASHNASSSGASGSSSGAPPPGADGQGHTFYPWLAVGAGVVATSIGITLLVAKPDTGCDLDNQTCMRKDGESIADFEKRQDEAGRERGWGIAGPILIVGGLALVGGGLLWYFLEPTGTKDTAKTKVRPQLGPGFAGLALTGRF